MQRKLSVILAFVMLVSAMALTACGAKAADPKSSEEPMAGGFSEDRQPETDELAIFEAVMADVQDAEYEPSLVATQVVAGTNYRFTAAATPKSPDAKPYSVYVYIYQPLDGEPELTEIETVNQ